jgi:flavin-dependent dehydrogenase
MPWRPRKVVQSIGEAHAALVGDAAGYVEPFTGEGIGWALTSAELLARCAASCEPGQWNESASRDYSRLWNAHVGRRQRLCRALAWTLERPMFANMMLRLAARLPRLADRIATEVVAA